MAAAGPELCPHCGRPFKRLRAHLPHCKAAPAPGAAPGMAPGTAPGTAAPSAPGMAPGTAAPSPPGLRASPSAGPRSAARPAPASAPIPQPAGGSVPGPSAAPEAGTGAGTGAGRGASRAVRAVARSMDLHPEEVRDVPRMLQKGLKVVIEKHRARVVREKGAPGSRRQGPEPGPAPQRRKNAQKAAGEEARSRGTAGSGAAGSRSSSKAAKALQESRSGAPGRPERRDECAAGEERARPHSGLGARCEPPECAPRPGSLQLALPAAGLGRGSSREELGVPEPPVSAGGAPAPLQTRPAGLEWFPALYPDYEGLRIFPGKRFQQDVRITEAPKGGLAQGQQGPLSERPLLEVRLGELHTWISTCSFSPQGLLGAVQRAWSSYCAKYIHVKQGGPAGISMLLAGYCLLSYGWNYQHLKRHRWRKYH